MQTQASAAPYAIITRHRGMHLESQKVQITKESIVTLAGAARPTWSSTAMQTYAELGRADRKFSESVQVQGQTPGEKGRD
jgi:hypothetical protein